MKRGAKYEERKGALADLIWKQTVALFPQLKDKVEYFEIGTPVTNSYYLNADKGEMYGLDHNKDRFTAEASIELRPEVSDVKGLYLTGQDVLSCGIVGAAIGGVLCSSSILKRNVYMDLLNLKKKSSPSIGIDSLNKKTY